MNLERWCHRHGRFEHVELPPGRDPATLPGCLEPEPDPKVDAAATFAAAVAAGALTAAEQAADEALAANDPDEERGNT